MARKFKLIKQRTPLRRVQTSQEALKEIKKGNNVWLDERKEFFSLDLIIDKMARSECLLCTTNVEKEMKRPFHILLCKKHRLEYLNRIYPVRMLKK